MSNVVIARNETYSTAVIYINDVKGANASTVYYPSFLIQPRRLTCNAYLKATNTANYSQDGYVEVWGIDESNNESRLSSTMIRIPANSNAGVSQNIDVSMYGSTDYKGVRVKFYTPGFIVSQANLTNIKLTEYIKVTKTYGIPSVNTGSANVDLNSDGTIIYVNIQDNQNADYRYEFDLYVNGNSLTSYANMPKSTKELILDSGSITKAFNFIGPNNQTGTLKINLQTFFNGQLVGVTDKTGTIKIVNSFPTFDLLGYEDINTNTVNVTKNNQLIIQNLSILQINVSNGAAKNGATIRTYEIIKDNEVYQKNANQINIGKLSKNINCIVAIIDSRGFRTEKLIPMQVISYSPPIITELKLTRLDDIEEQTYLYLKARYTPIIVNGENINGIREISYEDRVTNLLDVNVIALTVLPSSDYTVIDQDILSNNVFLANYDNLYSYEFIFNITDKFNTQTSSKTILTSGKPTISFAKNMVGIGKIPQKGVLDIAGDIFHVGKYNDSKIVVDSDKYNMYFRGILSNSSDLNSLRQNGIWVAPTDAIASNMGNSPAKNAGSLEVVFWEDKENGSVIQRYTSWNPVKQYVRSYYSYNSTWSKWEMFQQGRLNEIYKGPSSGPSSVNSWNTVTLNDAWWNYDFVIVTMQAGTNTLERCQTILSANVLTTGSYLLEALTDYNAKGPIELTGSNGNQIRYQVKQTIGWESSNTRLYNVLGIQL